MSSRRHALAFGLVMAAISHTGLAQTEAAEALRIPLSTLNQKIKRLNIDVKARKSMGG